MSTAPVSLARGACAGLRAAGRPVYAAWSTVDRPEDPLLQLWQPGCCCASTAATGTSPR